MGATTGGATPRIMPAAVVNLLNGLPKKERTQPEARLTKTTPIKGVTSVSTNILGKNDLNQVDVVMFDWDTGPELLISTERMDSSFGKNAANRVEESCGDAKNLRLRHPLAALGFAHGLRSTILTEEQDNAEWLIDLLQKLGCEDDDYHAVTLIMMEYGAGPLMMTKPPQTRTIPSSQRESPPTRTTNQRRTSPRPRSTPRSRHSPGSPFAVRPCPTHCGHHASSN